MRISDMLRRRRTSGQPPGTTLPRTGYRSPAVRLSGLPGAAALDRAEQARLRRRFPFGGAEKLILQRRESWLEYARVQAGVTGRMAAQDNFEFVTGLCAEVDLGYRVVPDPNSMTFRVLVEPEGWNRFVERLRAAGEREPLYVGIDAVTRTGALQRWADLTVRPAVAASLEDQVSLDVFRPVTPAAGVTAYGWDWACTVERWLPDEDGRLRAPSRNGWAEYVAPSLVSDAEVTVDGRTLPTIGLFTKRHLFDVDFPIDAVYLWVDGGDPDWQARKKQALEAIGGTWNEPDATTDARFRDGGELRYAFRSLRQFAPWVRHVYLVTDRQVPSWLDTGHPDLTVVDHRDLFGDTGRLPTFNSHAIGARLHHIPDLAEHYLYVNDDVFFGRDVAPSLFFDSNGMARFFVSRTSLGVADDSTRLSHESARRNVAELIERDFGRTPTNAFFHAPIPQRRSVMLELEQRYEAEFRTTLGNQFRSPTDIEPNSWLFNYYAYLTGQAMPGRIRYSYLSVGDPESEAQFKRLYARRDRDTFCLNDRPEASAAEHKRAAAWLAQYFPTPCAFEKSDTGNHRQR